MLSPKSLIPDLLLLFNNNKMYNNHTFLLFQKLSALYTFIDTKGIWISL